MPNQIDYAVDMVLCIDATGDMAPIIEMVKDSARSFYGKIMKALAEKGKNVSTFRIKVIVFRDYYHDGDKAMKISEFFTLPGQTDGFNTFISSIIAEGGGDEPESVLEAITLAMKSGWTTKGARQRHIITVWTGASAHPLEKASQGVKPENYPKDMPSTLTQLSDMWNDYEHQGIMNRAAKRLILFAPDMYPWNTIGNEWENTVWTSL